MRLPVFIWLFAILLGIALTALTWDIHFWPIDAEHYYLPALQRLQQLPYISQIHKELDFSDQVRWLHGKEVFILLASGFQRLFNDFTTLRPLVALCIWANFFSAVLIFYITRTLWGSGAALLCYFLFITSFWPYMYVLMAIHPPVGLFLFLLSLFFLLRVPAHQNLLYYFLSGYTLCLAFFASPLARSYFLFYAALAFFVLRKAGTNYRLVFIWLLGCVVPVIFINYPDVAHNLRGYYEFLQISVSGNHFLHNQPVLRQWLADPAAVKPSWVWIGKAFFIVMPVIFTLYLAACLGLVARGWRQADKRVLLGYLGMILLFSAPFIVIKLLGFAQCLRNYYASLVGLIGLIGYAFYVFFGKDAALPKSSRIRIAGGLVLLAHLVSNSYIFFSDVYPSRMFLSFLSKKVIESGVTDLYVYRSHPYNHNTVDQLKPELLDRIDLRRIDSVEEVSDGLVLLPPVTGESIYLAMTGTYTDFDEDLFLNEIIAGGPEALEKYAVGSYKTLAASRIWPLEEEILAYFYLIRGQFFKGDLKKGYAYLLDGRKLHQDREKFAPNEEFRSLVRTGFRRIGTRSSLYRFNGLEFDVEGHDGTFQDLWLRIRKIGAPADRLTAFVYKEIPGEWIWRPADKEYASQPVEASLISGAREGLPVRFHFPQPIELGNGKYKIVVYRGGLYSDQDHYWIDARYYKTGDPQGTPEGVDQ